MHQLNQTLDVVRKYLAAHVSILHPERFSKHTYTISQVSSDETAQTANKLTKIQTICILIIRLVDSLEISFVELFDKPDSSSFFHKLFYEVAEMVYFHLNQQKKYPFLRSYSDELSLYLLQLLFVKFAHSLQLPERCFVFAFPLFSKTIIKSIYYLFPFLLVDLNLFISLAELRILDHLHKSLNQFVSACRFDDLVLDEVDYSQ